MKKFNRVKNVEKNSQQDVVTGECNRLDHLIKMQLEKKLADKNLPQAEKEDINKTLALIEGMTMVRIADNLHCLLTIYLQLY